jgi:hypothetical protein
LELVIRTSFISLKAYKLALAPEMTTNSVKYLAFLGQLRCDYAVKQAFKVSKELRLFSGEKEAEQYDLKDRI